MTVNSIGTALPQIENLQYHALAFKAASAPGFFSLIPTFGSRATTAQSFFFHAPCRADDKGGVGPTLSDPSSQVRRAIISQAARDQPGQKHEENKKRRAA